MPETIIPSKPNYWRGTPSGASLTVEQINAIGPGGAMANKVAAFRRRGGMKTFLVKQIVEPKSIEGVPSHKTFECPVVSVSRDAKRICVVAPNGLETWVDVK